MILIILFALALGILLGVFDLIPCFFTPYLDTLLTVMLCMLMFVIGVDMSQNKTVAAEIKRMGIKIVLLPLFIAAGSIVGALCISCVTNVAPTYAMAIGAGFGWYTLSGVMLTSLVGADIGTMALLSNVFREVLAFMLVPVVVKYLGKISAIAPGGATSMDTTLPVVVKYAGSEMSVIAFISGIVLSLLVMVLVPLFAGL
ncbi:hypothetical protein CUJ83_14290 [Methanocella sp. CWC-04]|uniref:Lysine exporter LysO n=1 Tax=Methanooceanicella nereidis TaxID=2052831 RepID=A0AAP2RF12_9EURY|nr:lysine exporter LysO family protein [Methanocella sp. CWC-04]MCD1296169.1 hypothetical protein [Methanocella sp. CWC-04]